MVTNNHLFISTAVIYLWLMLGDAIAFTDILSEHVFIQASSASNLSIVIGTVPILCYYHADNNV